MVALDGPDDTWLSKAPRKSNVSCGGGDDAGRMGSGDEFGKRSCVGFGFVPCSGAAVDTGFDGGGAAFSGTDSTLCSSPDSSSDSSSSSSD